MKFDLGRFLEGLAAVHAGAAAGRLAGYLEGEGVRRIRETRQQEPTEPEGDEWKEPFRDGFRFLNPVLPDTGSRKTPGHSTAGLDSRTPGRRQSHPHAGLQSVEVPGNDSGAISLTAGLAGQVVSARPLVRPKELRRERGTQLAGPRMPTARPTPRFSSYANLLEYVRRNELQHAPPGTAPELIADLLIRNGRVTLI